MELQQWYFLQSSRDSIKTKQNKTNPTEYLSKIVCAKWNGQSGNPAN